MIKQSSLQLAEMIAVGHPDRDVHANDVVNGLVSVSYGANSYSATGYRQEIGEVTSEITNHTELLDLTTTRLAQIVRECLYNVRDYGVPLAQAVAGNTGFVFSKKKLSYIIDDRLQLEYVSLDDPFFNSDLYPTVVDNKTLSYENTSLDMLSRLEFSYPEKEDVAKLVESSNAEVRSIVEDLEEDLRYAATSLTDLDSLRWLLANDGKTNFNFTQIKTIRINLLLKMYIVATKMYTSDDPVSWLKAGSLADYREFVSLIWNGLTRYLINLREVVGVYRSQGLVFQPVETVRLSDHHDTTFKGVKFLTGKVRVFYADSVLTLASEENASISQVITGHFWRELSTTQGVLKPGTTQAMIVDGKQGFNEYLDYISGKLKEDGGAVFVKNGLRAINEFLNTKPELIERINEVRKNTRQEGSLWSTWVENTFSKNLRDCYHLALQACDEEEDDAQAVLHAFMGSSLVTDFLRSLGATMAAEIIEVTSVKLMKGEDNTADKRQRLHVALIDVLANKLLKQG